jgi:hypothetical protein
LYTRALVRDKACKGTINGHMGDDSAAAFSGGHGTCEVSHIGTYGPGSGRIVAEPLDPTREHYSQLKLAASLCGPLPL